MKERIEIQKIFTIDECNNNLNKFYIYGDNLVHQGTGGQAVIRYCNNTIGIPTKRLPSMSNDAFFSDQQDEINAVNKRLGRLFLLYNKKENYTLVFPKDGLGTGRARLKEKSPLIYKLINDFLKQYFELNIMP